MRTIRFARAPLLLLLSGIAVATFSLTFTHFAGSFGGPGFEDGSSAVARFKSDYGVATDSSGNVYVADTGNQTIRKIALSGEVTTVAGLAETSGSSNGRGAHGRFSSPQGVVADGSGNLYVADTSNHAIRKISSSGVVSTFAGLPGVFGFVNATGTAARFNAPRGLTFDGSGNLYVADTGNHSIRKIASDGSVTTFAGTGSSGSTNATGTGASFSSPSGVVYDSTTAALYVADYQNNAIRKITVPGAVVSTFAGQIGSPTHQDGTPGRFYNPRGIAVDAAGTFYVADPTDNAVRAITTGGTVSTLAGLVIYPGPDDGTGGTARFYQPSGVAVSGTNVFVTDTGNNTVRKIDLSGGTTVSTYAGLANASGFVNGVGSVARFNSPSGVTYYPGPSWCCGFLYVADKGNNAIRAVDSDGTVTTLAGGTYGYQNGNGTNAWFRAPEGVAGKVSDRGVYVADTGNHCIRLIDSAGNVTLFAGQPGSSGSDEGDRLTTARFNSPKALALDTTGAATLYVADTGNYKVRKIDLSTGQVSTLAGSGSFGVTNGTGAAASLGVLTGITANSFSGNNVFVTESTTYTVRKITSGGVTSTFAGACCSGPVDGTGTSARFGYPGPVSILSDGYQSAIVADKYGHEMRTMTLDGAVVGTAGGKANVNGTSDGTQTFARFNSPSAVGGFPSYFAITEGHTIRLAWPDFSDRATIDSSAGLVGTARQLDMSPNTATSWSWSIIRKPSTSSATLSATNIRNPTFTPDVADLYVFRCVATNASGYQSISTVSLQGNGAASSLNIGYPGPQTAGTPFNLSVTAFDSEANTADGYLGQVHFTSNDPNAVLPSDYTFTLADHGAHTFSVTLKKAGTPSITVKDTVNGSLTGITFVVTNPAAADSLQLTTPASATAGTAFNATVKALDPYGNTATGYTGTVHFTSSDGAATLPSNRTFTGGDAGIVTFTSGVTLRTVGSQSVTVTDIVNGSLTATQNVSVSLAPPASITATATSTPSVLVSWPASLNADHYEVYRQSAGSPFALYHMTSGTSFLDSGVGNVAANASYIYKVRAVDVSSNMSAFTVPDVATTITFTDDPILAHATQVRSTHILQLRNAVQYFSDAAGTSSPTYTYPATAGTKVRAADILELRTALNAARTNVGMTSLTFTDSLAGSTQVKAVHVTEIRDGVK